MRKQYDVTITGKLTVDSDDLELEEVEEGSIEWDEQMLEEAERIADEVMDGIALQDPSVEVNE